MSKKVEQLKGKLDKLEKEINDKDEFYKKELIDWIVECTALFSQLKVNNEIIKRFIDVFDVRKIGFEEETSEKARASTEPNSFSHCNHSFTGGVNEIKDCYKMNESGKNSKNIFYVNLAFTTARAIIENEEENERLVPKYLIETLFKSGNYLHIISSLELIEDNYEERNSDGLITNTVTLLDSILNLDEDLRIIKNEGKKDRIRSIGLKLEFLEKNVIARQRFGVSHDIIKTLNNARVIRNVKNVHKKDSPIEFNTPFIVAMGFASITILFLEMTNATGEVIK